MIKMKDIAKMAGVSQATVSRVLSGSTTVSPARKAKVMEWVRKLDFEPNLTAKALAAKRSFLIGVVVPDLMNPYFSEILAHIEKYAAMNGYNIIIANSEGNITREKEIIKSLKARQVDGILIGLSFPDSPVLETLKEQKTRTVIITQHYEGIDCIGVSHRHGGSQVARHFLTEGIERFAFFGPRKDDKYLGFYDELITAGVKKEQIDLIGNEEWWLNMLDRGLKQAIRYLQTHRNKARLGVFSVNDPFALGVVHAAQELEMKIPEEIAVVGFDDTFICQNVKPMLSSVAQPIDDISRISVEMLLNRIEDPGFDADEQILLEPKLVRRETS